MQVEKFPLLINRFEFVAPYHKLQINHFSYLRYGLAYFDNCDGIVKRSIPCQKPKTPANLSAKTSNFGKRFHEAIFHFDSSIKIMNDESLCKPAFNNDAPGKFCVSFACSFAFHFTIIFVLSENSII